MTISPTPNPDFNNWIVPFSNYVNTNAAAAAATAARKPVD
jgi:hypothetical protein